MPDEYASSAIDHTAFYVDPNKYDLLTSALSGDAPAAFYRSRARRYGGPVLELATGTGRLAIPIAQEGIDIVGLDVSAEMLSTADRKARASAQKITWISQDMRSFHLDRLFQFIFVASNSFSHLYSRADVEACLGCIRRHMAKSGRLILDIFNPALGLFVRPPDHRSPVATFEDNQSGTTVSVSKSVRYNSATQISHETWYFHDAVSGNEYAVPLNLRMFFPQEIDALLHYNGFAIEQKYADYEEHAFDESSRKQVIICTASDRS